MSLAFPFSILNIAHPATGRKGFWKNIWQQDTRGERKIALRSFIRSFRAARGKVDAHKSVFARNKGNAGSGQNAAYGSGSAFLSAGTGVMDGFGGIGEIWNQYHREDCKRDSQGEDDGEGYSGSHCEFGF